MSERLVEVPYLLNNIKDNSIILDVGVDRVGYTYNLIRMGCQVSGCDPMRSDCEYPIRFQDMSEDKKFDVIILLSTLEHFAPNQSNYETSEVEIEAIKKCSKILNPDGIIIITVPFGLGKIYEDFIQWDCSILDRIVKATGVKVVDECVFKCKLINGEDIWELSSFIDTINNEYFVERGHASSVYLGVWKF